jgi:hypothetical protein
VIYLNLSPFLFPLRTRVCTRLQRLWPFWQN